MLTGSGSRDSASAAPAFLTRALGRPQAGAPLIRKPVPGLTTEVTSGGYSIGTPSKSLGLDSLNASGQSWRRFANGVTRPTGFGQETVKFSPYGVEQLSTVDSRQGERIWRWKLGTRNLRPQLGADGSVGLMLPTGILGLRIRPVAIFNERGRNITPKDLSWSLRRSDTSSFLELRLDDSKLPLPYVIDPSATFGAAVGGASNNNGSANVDISVSPGVPAGATLFVTGAEATATTTGAWSASDTHSNTYVLDKGDANSTGVRMGILRSSVTTALASGDTITILAPVSGGGIARVSRAFYFTGIVATLPLDVSGANTGVSTGPTVSTSAVTTQADELVVAAIANTAITPPALTAGSACNGSTVTSIFGTSQPGQPDLLLQPLFKNVSATGTQTCSGTYSSIVTWSAAIATYKVDLPPSVSSITASSPTNSSSINYTVTFSESVSPIVAGDFALTATGVSGASIGTPTGSGTTSTVPVNTDRAKGTIRLDVNDSNHTILDSASNALSPSTFTTGTTVTVDKTAPSVSSITAPSPTFAPSINYTVTFSESVSPVVATDFVLTTTGVSAPRSAHLPAPAQTRAVTVNPLG